MDALHRFKNDLQNQNFSTEFGIGKKVALCRFRNFERKKERKKLPYFSVSLFSFRLLFAFFPTWLSYLSNPLELWHMWQLTWTLKLPAAQRFLHQISFFTKALHLLPNASFKKFIGQFSISCQYYVRHKCVFPAGTFYLILACLEKLPNFFF